MPRTPLKGRFRSRGLHAAQLGEVGETRSPASMPVWLCPVSELLCIYMYLIVVGAGPEGSSLAELALKDGHEVAIIEASSERARAVLQKCDARVFHASIAQGEILDEADADRADALIAIIPVLLLFSSLLRPLRRAIHRQRRS
ncbi:NAD-binding protein [Kamptonema formosum]|uniref:NAD-binding protein n=1 Tax=Kamptonema formosum TaxID=331992 RepID=UPI00036ED7E4|nr:NAD-binding protein [Oscillatoria sp. PCC 10802]